MTVIDGNPTAVTFALAGEDDLVEGDETSATVTLGRGLRAGETVTVPLVVAGTGVDASDYTLTLDTGASSSGVSLAISAPYNSHQPAVVFTGSDDAEVTTATLDLTTLADGAAETREAFTLWMGTLDSSLDLETGTGARGTAARGSAAFIQLRDRVVPVSGAPEVRISHKFLPVVENGPPGRYLLWLGSDPGQDVTVDITSSDPARVRVEPAELTFTTRGETIWSEAQSVTVTALPDADGGQDSTVTLTHAVTGYPGVSSAPLVTVTHRDAGHGVMASARTLELSEGATAGYTLRLLSRPTHAVTVTPRVSDSGAVLRGGAAVTFQPNEWETEKTFAVAGLSPGRATVTHDVSSTDSSYGGAGGTRYGVAPLAVTVASAPTRIAGAAFTVAPDTASVVGGAAAAFTVSAGNALAGDVAVEVDITDGGDVVAAGQFLTRKVLVPAGGSSRLSLDTKAFPADRPDGAVTATLAARYGGASASVQVVDNLPTPVSLDFGADLRLREQTPGDTAEVKVTLGRDLAPGEVVEVPLAFATTDGVALPGAAAPHVAVSATGAGVTLQGATTTTPTVRFTGGAGVERVATVELAATATVDANLTDDTFTIGLGDLAAATLATTVSGGAVATGGSNQARLTLVDSQEAFEVSLAGGDDLGLVEALPGDTATVTVTLERDLAAGEIVEVPLAFASTTGVVLPGGTTPHVQVLSATGAGVTLHGATTTTPTVRFTGGAGSEQVATVAMAATGQDDGDTADDSFTVALGDLAAGGLATNLGVVVTPAAGANLAQLTLFDDDNPFTVALRAGGDVRLLEEAPGDTGSVVVLLERDLVAGELVEVPLAFASTSGLTLPGGTTPHVQVLSATGAGVSLHDAATATPKVRITGGAGSERVAEVQLAATGQDDGNRTDDTFTVSLGDLSDATLATELTGAVTASGASHSAVLTVIDNDVGVAISDASAAEGEAMVFTVTLPKAAPAGGVTVRYTVHEGTGGALHARATAPADFGGSRGGAVTIAEGQTSGTVSVPTVDDNVYESEHRFTVRLVSSSLGPLHPTDYEAVGTITDAADLPQYGFLSGQYRVSEGGTVGIVVAQGGSATSLLPATVSFAPAGDGDTAGAGDYSGASGSLTFAPGGASRQEITVGVLDDNVPDFDEHFTLVLTAGAHAKVGASAASRVEIVDNDPVTVGVEAAASVHEGEEVVFTFAADATVENDLPLKVRLTQQGSYVSATDIREDSLVLKGGSASATLSLPTSENDSHETDGSVRATLLPGDGYALDVARSAARVVIDGAEPTLRVRAAGGQVSEGNDAEFTLSADFAPARDLTVALGVAEEGHVAAAGQTGNRQVILKSGEAQATLAVETDDDTTTEAAGAISATLAAGTGYAVGADSDRARVVVVDDDGSPSAITLTVDADTGRAGEQDALREDGGAKTVRVTATIDDGSRFDTDQVVTVRVGKGGDSAEEGTDYATIPDQTINLRQGATSGYVEFLLTPVNDSVSEPVKVISLTGTLAGASFTDTAIRLLDDETPEVRVEAKQPSVPEGETATFTVRLLVPPAAPVTVNYEVSGTGGHAAAATGSVEVPTSGSVEITVASIDVAGDAPNGTLTVTPTDGTGYQVSERSAGSVEVVDDEPTSVALRGSRGMTEGEVSRTGVLVVELGRELVAGERVRVPLRFATGARDFLSGALARRDVVVHAVGADSTALNSDTQKLAEGVWLFGPGSAELAGQRTPPNSAVYAVEFTGGPDTPRSATLHLTARAERAPNDRTDANITVNFRGLTSAALTNLGGGLEPDRRQSGALFRVVDADKLVVSTRSLALTEGGTASYNVQFDNSTRAPSQNVTVTITAGDGALVSTAGSPTLAATKTLTFTRSNWKTGQTVTVTATDDPTDDPGKTVSVTHTADSADVKFQHQKPRDVVVRVTDNDPTGVVLAAASGNLSEGQTREVTLTLDRGLVQGEALTVPLTFAGTAVRGTDYTLAGATAAGVVYHHLDSGAASVVFTGPDTGATAATATLTLTAVRDGTEEAMPETVDIGLGTLVATGLDGGVDSTDSLAGFSIEDPAEDGATVSTASLALTELHPSDAEKTYTLALNNDPGAEVVVTVTSADNSAVRVDTDGDMAGDQDTLTFTHGIAGTWNDVRTVTVRAVNDGDAAAESVRVTHNAAVASDSTHPYHGIAIDAVTVTTTDAGHGVVVSESSRTVAANDETATYTLVLQSNPGGTLVVTPASDHPSRATVSGALTFTPGNWSVPQTVTVTGKGEGATTLRHTVTTATTDYPAGTSIDPVAVTITPDPRPVITISGGEAVTEGTAASFTVTASPAPGANLTVNLTVTASGAFVASEDAGGKSVTVGTSGRATYTVDTVADSTDEMNGGVTVAVPPGSGYRVASGASDTATVAVLDDDATAVTLAGTGVVQEDGSDSVDVTVTLGRNLRVGETVTVPLGVAGPGIAASDYAIALQTGSNLNQGVTLNTTTPHSADAPAVVFAGHATNTVQVATLTVTARSDTDDERSAEVLTLGFGSGNRAVASNLDRATGTGTAGTTPTGTASVTITDDDPTTVTLASAASGNLAEGRTRVITLTLGRGLVSGESLTVPLTFAGTATRGTDYTLVGATAAGVVYNNLDSGTASVVFTGPNSGATATTARLTLAAVSDGSEESPETVDTGIGTLVPTGLAGGAEETDSLAVFSITDPPTHGVAVSTASVQLTELHETDFDATYRLTFTSDPGADVVVTVTSDDTTAVVIDTDADKAGDQGSFTVTHGSSGNWNEMRNIFLRARNDADTVGETVTLRHAATVATDSSNPYHGIDIDNVRVTVTDAGHGVVVPTTTIRVSAGDDTTTYDIVLRSDPGGTVVVTPTSDTPANATVSGALTFTSGNWSTPQEVTVTGKQSGSATLSHAVTTPTTAYPISTDIGSVAVTILPAPSIDSTEIREGETKTFTVINIPHSWTSGILGANYPGTAQSFECVLLDTPNALPNWDFCVGRENFDTDTRTFTTELSARADGVYDPDETFTMILNDQNDSSRQVSFTLTVREPPPAITITGGSAVTEGTAASFTVTADPVPRASLTVNLEVSETGDFVADDDEGEATVTLPTSGTATLTVDTVADSTDEANDGVQVTVSPGTDYEAGSPDAATVDVTDDDATPVVLGGGGTAAEDGSAAAEVTITLGRDLVAGETVTVPLVVSGAGVAASDYTIARKTGSSLNAGVTLDTADARKTGSSLNAGVTLDTADPHSADAPAVVFAGDDANPVRVATLVVTAGQDAEDEGSGGDAHPRLRQRRPGGGEQPRPGHGQRHRRHHPLGHGGGDPPRRRCRSGRGYPFHRHPRPHRARRRRGREDLHAGARFRPRRHGRRDRGVERHQRRGGGHRPRHRGRAGHAHLHRRQFRQLG